MILYDLPDPTVEQFAELICEAVARVTMSVAEDGKGRAATVTVSVGVGTVVPSIGRRDRVAVKGADAYRTLDTGKFETSYRSRQRS